jgi:prepilin-type N-terminal cleavage/methylation domain-containing protein
LLATCQPQFPVGLFAKPIVIVCCLNSEQIRSERRAFRHGGFSLIELLVVIAIIAILAALILPAVDIGKRRTVGIGCMNNHRQLALAWRMYSDDNNDALLFASESLDWDKLWTADYAWITGTLTYSPTDPRNWNPDLTIKKSPLWSYSGKNLNIWKCPADRSGVTVSGEFKPRVRSISMNVFLGGWGGTDGNWGSVFSAYKIYTKQTQLIDPGPSKVFVFLDMREDSIDMGNFATRMAGWPDDSSRYGFYDLPGYYHHRACGFSFADGHSEIHRWRDQRTMPPIVSGGFVNDQFSSPNNRDVGWLQEHSTRPLSPP